MLVLLCWSLLLLWESIRELAENCFLWWCWKKWMKVKKKKKENTHIQQTNKQNHIQVTLFYNKKWKWCLFLSKHITCDLTWFNLLVLFCFSKLSALINIPDLKSKLKMKENYFKCASIYKRKWDKCFKINLYTKTLLQCSNEPIWINLNQVQINICH